MNERFPSEPTQPIDVEYRIHADGVETRYLPPQPKQNIRFHLSLLVLTFLTTTIAGSNGYIHPQALLYGLLYSIPLLVILLFHEFGHYLMARKYGVDATLPYVIPGIPILIGTFGAVIKMRSPVRTKSALFDIGVAGPLAGMAVALPITIFGLWFSRIESFTPSQSLQGLGDSLLFYALCRFLVGTPSDAYHTIILHPTAFAGWVGMLVTMLNLLPVGQLDGGHVTYAIMGRNRHQWLGKIVLPALLFFGALPLPQIIYILVYEVPATGIIEEIAKYGWLGWLLWFVILKYLIKPTHPPVMDEAQPLDRRRILLGWLALLIFVLTFTPAPFIMNFEMP